MKGKRLVIAGQKGGVAKTTTCVSVAHALALAGKTVCIVDGDPQGHAAMFLNVDRESGVFDWLVGGRPFDQLARLARENLWILPGDRRTSTGGQVLVAERADLSVIDDMLARARLPDGRRPDWWLFDTSPGVGFVQEALFYAADLMLAMLAMDEASMDGLSQVMTTLSTVNRVRARERGDLEAQCNLLYVVPTMYDKRTVEAQAVLDELDASPWKERVFKPPIFAATIFRRCVAEGKTIFEMPLATAQERRARDDYVRLAREVSAYG